MIVATIAADDSARLLIYNDSNQLMLDESFPLEDYADMAEGAISYCTNSNISTKLTMDPRLEAKLQTLQFETMQQTGMLEQFD